MKKYQIVDLPGLRPIEAEKGEVLVTPNAKTYIIGGKSHKRGGTGVIAPEGSVILSRHLKLSKEVTDALIGDEKELSPADIAKRFPTDKYLKVIEDTGTKYDALAKRTAQLMLNKTMDKQRQIFDAQELTKQARGIAPKKKMQDGGFAGVDPNPDYGVGIGQGMNGEDYPFVKGNPNHMQMAEARRDNFAPSDDYTPDQLPDNPIDFMTNGPSGLNAGRLFYQGWTPASHNTDSVQIRLPYGSASNYAQSRNGQLPPQQASGEFRDVNLYGFPEEASGELTDPLAPSGNLFSTNPFTPKQGGKRDMSFLREQDPMKLYSFAERDKMGYTMEDGLITVKERPLSGSDYFKQQAAILNSRPLSKSQKAVLAKHQDEISHLERYGNPDGIELGRAVAMYHREADKIEKDRFLTKFIELPDGTNVELVNATDDQISKAVKIKYHNNRTGQDDLVDLRDRQNQGPNPTMVYQAKPNVAPLERLPSRKLGLDRPPSVPPVTPPTTPPINDKGKVKQTTNMMNIVNGVQLGLLAADFAGVREEVPYYAYRPSELAYTRYKPINTKQSERAFNILKESLDGSNMPESLKQARLSAAQATMTEGANQVDLANYQNAQANDNANINRFFDVRNQDIQREQQVNSLYLDEVERRRLRANQQRQVYLNSAMSIWRDIAQSRSDINLVNQLSRNYDYNNATGTVEYQRGSTPLVVPPSLAQYQRQTWTN